MAEAPVAAQRDSQVYSWEPSDEAIARLHGLDPRSIVRFDTNTSPGAPEWVEEVLREPFEPPLNEYPDSTYRALTDAAAAHVGVEPDRILVGAGADEVLDIAAKTFLPPTGVAVIPTPTYAMYRVLTSQRGAEPRVVARGGAEAGFALDVAALVEALRGADLVWLCDPNNPTGAQEPPGTIEAVLEHVAALGRPPIVVVDEAYAEFVGRSVVPLVGRHPNVIVVRTVSKAFALPGARVGYAVAARPTIAAMERLRPPGSISTISATLAAHALRRPADAERRVAKTASARTAFAEGLAAIGWQPYPSVTNFVLVRVGDARDADEAAGRLLRLGLVPRTFPGDHPLRGHLRLTVRAPAENARLLEAAAA